MNKLINIFMLLLLSFPVLAQQSSWKFDPAHTRVQFSVTHMLISEVTGNFRKFDGTVKTKGNDFTDAEINFTIDVKSINTENDRRDEHLRSDDFFNAEKYPSIKFTGKSMKKVGNNKYKLTGDLTMRDLTKQVVLDVTQGGWVKDRNGNDKTGFKIEGTLNRFDFNLKWNSLLETGGAVVGDEVNLICNVQLAKQS